MASRSNLGRIRPYPKGAYSAAVEYVYFDMVTNDGSTYLYINTTASTGTAITDTAYWQCLAQKGDKGIDGINGTNGTNGTNGADGLSSLWIRYSTVANPTDADLTTTPSDYMGLCVTSDITATAPTTASSYIWYKIRGEQGVQGPAGTIAIGNVTSGATPSVTNTGTSNAAVLDIVLPNTDTVSNASVAGIDLGNVSGTVTLDLAHYSMFKMKATAAIAITFTGLTDITQQTKRLTLIFDSSDTANYQITWPVSIIWHGEGYLGYTGRSYCIIIDLYTLDGGTTWYGRCPVSNG